MNNEFNKLTTTTLYHRGGKMPLTKTGQKVLSSMTKEYGAKKGKSVFYASINKKKKGSKKWHAKGAVKGY